MATIKRIVTSEIQGRTLSDDYGDNSYLIAENGRVEYYGPTQSVPVIGPGIVYGANADSGDGFGYNTIKLVPNAPYGDINDDRYLIIDPTAPNHIHIRAGGIQDASNAELILGAEQANVKVTDYNHQVSVNTYDSGTTTSHNWTFGADGVLYGPEGTVPAKAAAPTTANDPGTTGQVSWDTDYFYVCVAQNTWKRVALSTW
jgi:hypothetical protein